METCFVAASFTAEPIASALRFWLELARLPASIRFAPYNQLFQLLLDPGSELSTNAGLNVLLLRIADWARFDRRGGEALADRIRRTAAELRDALAGAAGRLLAPTLLVLCPSPPGEIDPELRAEAEGVLARGVEELRGIHLLTADRIARLYPVVQPFDPEADRMGHVPYSDVYFAALGTAVARHYHALVRSPAKVVVLDCDNTLWSGVVGEDGPLGVQVGPARAAFQRFLIRQTEAGRLLCLASKNTEEDVLAVFERNPAMVLRREHLVSWRIGWEPKSVGIAGLAEELGLGIDSFVFFDDSPIECAEVRAALPAVTVVELPAEDRIQELIDHLWPLDILRVTDEDRLRTRSYQDQAERERARRAAGSFAQFLAGLELELEIAPLSEEVLPRAAQLTQRTNQFNASTIRRGEAELRQLQREGATVEVVEVRDRFGDYGKVGVMISTEVGGALRVDTFLLSCRVLGRGVETEMIRHLGRRARERQLELRLLIRPSPRNQPARDFFARLPSLREEKVEGGSELVLAAEAAAELDLATAVVAGEARPATAAGVPSASGAGDKAVQLALSLHAPEEIWEAVRRARLRAGPLELEERAASDLERVIAEAIAEVLAVEHVGVDRSLLDLGGDSLSAVLVGARLSRALGRVVPAELVLDRGTPAAIAAALADGGRPLPTVAALRAPLPEPVGPRPPVLPLTPMQQGLLLTHQLGQGAAMNIPLLLRLDGELDLSALQHALDVVVARHEALRTTFVEDPRPRQVVWPPASYPIERLEVEGSDPAERERRGVELCAERAWQSFDPTRDLPLRVVLVSLARHQHLLLLVLDHLAADGRSMGIVLEELGRIYSSRRLGASLDLLAPPLQLADYAIWYRSWCDEEKLAPVLATARERLRGARPPQLCLDRPRPSSYRSEGSALELELPAVQVAALTELGRRNRATLFMVLFAGLARTLSRFGQPDVLITSPASARFAPTLEGLVGQLAGIQLLHLRVEPDQSFVVLVEEAREAALFALGLQEIPPNLFAPPELAAGAGRGRLSTVSFAIEDYERQVPTLAGLETRLASLPRRLVPNELFISAWPTGDGLHLEWGFASSVFDEETVRRIAEDFRSVLVEGVEHPELPFTKRALASSRSLAARLGAIRAGDPPLDPATLLARACCSEAPAVLDPTRPLSYRELGARSLALAGVLRERAGERLELALPAGPELVVAIVAAVRAGICYQVLDDPSQPLVPGACRLGVEELGRWLSEAPRSEAPLSEGGDGDACDVIRDGGDGLARRAPVTRADLARLASLPELLFPGVGELVVPGSQPSTAYGSFELWLALIRGATLDLGRLRGEPLSTPHASTLLLTESQLLAALSGGTVPPPGLGRVLVEWSTRSARWLSRLGIPGVQVLGLEGVLPAAARAGAPTVAELFPGFALRVLDRTGHAPPPMVPGRLELEREGASPLVLGLGHYLPDGTVLPYGRFSPLELDPVVASCQLHLETLLESSPEVRAALILPGPDGPIAWIAPDPSRPADLAALRSRLAGQVASGLLPREIRRLRPPPTTAAGAPDLRDLGALTALPEDALEAKRKAIARILASRKK